MMAVGGGHYEGKEQNLDQRTHVVYLVLQEESESNGDRTNGNCIVVECGLENTSRLSRLFMALHYC